MERDAKRVVLEWGSWIEGQVQNEGRDMRIEHAKKEELTKQFAQKAVREQYAYTASIVTLSVERTVG